MFLRILSIIAFGFLVSSCGTKNEIVETKPIEVRTIEVAKPAPIVPKSDVLILKDVVWVVVDKTTADSKLKDGTAYFALDAEQYGNLAGNLSLLRVIVQQKDAIIRTYESYFE